MRISDWSSDVCSSDLRVDGSSFVPYYDRTAIERGALANRGLEIAWAADAAEFFFLQVQGSGRLRLPDGSIMRIGYDSQNGRDYVGIGKLLLDRGELQPGQASMQGIPDYLRADQARGRSAGRRVVEEGVGTWRSRWWPVN